MKRAILTIIIISLLPGLIAGCSKKQNKKRNPKKQAYSKPLVKVKGRTLLADYDKNGQYEPFFIKGVGYHPMPVGRHPSDWGWQESFEDRIDNIFNDEELLRRDFEFLKKMGCNTIRIWKANNTFRKGKKRYPNRMTTKTLDLAEEYGIKVIAGFWIDTKEPKCGKKGPIYKTPDFTKEGIRIRHIKPFVKFINRFKKHPAILFWAIGNENNYHIDSLDFDKMQAFYSLINEMASAAHKAEGKRYHPVAFVNGDIETIGEIIYETADIDMEHLDVWGTNVYRGESFGNLFEDYSQRSQKPLWISEYGLDSWNSVHHTTPTAGGEDQETQAKWVGNMWGEIVANKKIVIGATVMEYSDEWWKPNEWLHKGQYNNTHDHFGTGPQDFDCDGNIDWYPPAPDNFFHQEWFGIMSIKEQDFDLDNVIPKKVYYTLKEKFSGG